MEVKVIITNHIRKDKGHEEMFFAKNGLPV